MSVSDNNTWPIALHLMYFISGPYNRNTVVINVKDVEVMEMKTGSYSWSTQSLPFSSTALFHVSRHMERRAEWRGDPYSWGLKGRERGGGVKIWLQSIRSEAEKMRHSNSTRCVRRRGAMNQSEWPASTVPLSLFMRASAEEKDRDLCVHSHL